MHTMFDIMTEKRTVRMAITGPPAVRAALEKAADDERRTMSTKGLMIIEEWLIDHGYLPRPSQSLKVKKNEPVRR